MFSMIYNGTEWIDVSPYVDSMSTGPMGTLTTQLYNQHSQPREQPMYDYKSMPRADLISELQAFEEKFHKKVNAKVRENTEVYTRHLEDAKSCIDKERQELEEVTRSMHLNLSLSVLNDARLLTNGRGNVYWFPQNCPYRELRLAIKKLQDAMAKFGK